MFPTLSYHAHNSSDVSSFGPSDTLDSSIECMVDPLELVFDCFDTLVDPNTQPVTCFVFPLTLVVFRPILDGFWPLLASDVWGELH